MADQSVIELLDARIAEARQVIEKEEFDTYDYRHFAENLQLFLCLKKLAEKELIQKQCDFNVEKRGFLLLAQNGTHPPRYEHEYYDEAETEAKRLALLTKGYVHILHKVATVAPSYQVVITTVEYKGKTSETKEETIDLTRDSELPF